MSRRQLGRRQFASLRELLHQQCGGRKHHRLRTKWARLFEFLLRPFPVLGSPLASRKPRWWRHNPAVGSNIMYFPSGRSQYQAIHFAYHTSSAANPVHLQKIDLALAYTSRAIAATSLSPMAAAETTPFSMSPRIIIARTSATSARGLDRTHQFVFTPTVETPHGPRISMIIL